ncbi:hypothetical protein [Methylobacterium nigriterrae]|uniref:hypothetical protein n=1 Tax=Methylobacterium nigriterrae TaxID=3127512 RepID=UPI003013C3B6
MRQFLVTFHKVVSDDTGHDHSVMQQRAVVRARSDVSALYEAKALFCRRMGVVDWRLRADTCDITDIVDWRPERCVAGERRGPILEGSFDASRENGGRQPPRLVTVSAVAHPTIQLRADS